MTFMFDRMNSSMPPVVAGRNAIYLAIYLFLIPQATLYETNPPRASVRLDDPLGCSFSSMAPASLAARWLAGRQQWATGTHPMREEALRKGGEAPADRTRWTGRRFAPGVSPRLSPQWPMKSFWPLGVSLVPCGCWL